MKQTITALILLALSQMAHAGFTLDPDTDFHVSYLDGVLYATVLTDNCNAYGYEAKAFLPCVPAEPGGIVCMAVNSISIDFHTQTEMYCEDQSYKTYAFDVSEHQESLEILGSVEVNLVGHPGKTETVIID